MTEEQPVTLGAIPHHIVREALDVYVHPFSLTEPIDYTGDVAGWELRFAEGSFMEITVPFAALPADWERIVAAATTATVRLWKPGPKGARVSWGEADQLEHQTPASVLSLIRMVAREACGQDA